MSESKAYNEDFEFIFNEARRLINLLSESNELYKNDFNNDFDLMTATLQPPKDVTDINPRQRQFRFSSGAQKKLREIATRQVKSHALDTSITVDEFISHIRDELYLHIKNSSSFDKGFQSLLSKAHKRAKRDMAEKTYYFPLNAPNFDYEDEILIGSVKIVHKDKIYSKVSDNSHYKLFVDSNNFESFNCLLCITIPPCSDKISENRARNVANFIYGVLKVFTTSYNLKANRLSLINNPTKSDITHYIVSDNGGYSIGGSYKFGEDLSEFWKDLKEDLKSDLGRVIKKLTEYAISPIAKERLADRLIDAFYWFGDASRDNNSSAQVVKIVTSLERLVTLSIEKNDAKLTKRFTKRVSSLIAIYHSKPEKWLSQAEAIYELRSQLVHGSQSICKSQYLDLDFDPFKLAVPTILSACIEFDKLGLDTIKYEPKLQSMFTQLVEE